MPNIPVLRINGTDYNIKDKRVDDLKSALSQAVSFKGSVQALGITDINSIVENGIYVCSDYTGITGLPTDGNNVPIVGTIIVMSSLNVGNYRGVQYLIGRDGKIYSRVKNSISSNWSEWSFLLTSTNAKGNIFTEFEGGQIIDNTVLTDANNARNNTVYRINVINATRPNNLPIWNGVLFTIGWNEDGADTSSQIAISGENYYYRSNWNRTWSDWIKIENRETLFTSFETYSVISKIIKNVSIVGTTDRLLISNIRNNYNGQTGFVIYKSNDIGEALSIIINETGIQNLKGTYISQIPAYNNTATIQFEYDLTQIADGNRYAGTGMEYLISKRCYYGSNLNYYGDFGFVENFGVIGDSYASGEVYTDADNENGYIADDYYNLSWGQVLARKYGSTCTNFSKGGLSTKTWLTDEKGLSLLNSESPKQLYFCALGINDQLKHGANYIGSITDIHNNPEENPDTFYGNYGRIIEAIKTKSPNAKIIFITYAYNYGATEISFNNAIKAIASHYGVPCFDVYKRSFFSQYSWYHTGKKWNHPTAPIYAAMAKEYADMFEECVTGNNYFEDYTGN